MVASWQSHFCLLFKLIKIFSDIAQYGGSTSLRKYSVAI